MRKDSTNKGTVVDSLVDVICAEIFRSERKPGQKLPPIRTLAGDYGVTVPTVQRAVARLKEMNLVAVRQGSGVTVQDPWTHAGLSAIPRWLDALLDEPAQARRVLEDFLELRREMAISLLVGLRHREVFDEVEAAIDEFEEIASGTPDDLKSIAAADIAVGRAFLELRPQIAFATVFNAFEEILVALPELREAIYVDPQMNVAGYRAALEALKSSADEGELRGGLRALLVSVDEESARRFEAILLEDR